MIVDRAEESAQLDEIVSVDLGGSVPNSAEHEFGGHINVESSNRGSVLVAVIPSECTTKKEECNQCYDEEQKRPMVHRDEVPPFAVPIAM